MTTDQVIAEVRDMLYPPLPVDGCEHHPDHHCPKCRVQARYAEDFAEPEDSDEYGRYARPEDL